MSADLQQPTSSSLSPRAGIAMLTLQIRATLQEAAEVEAQYVDIDHEAAKRQLRERLEPLVHERTRSFTEAIDAARAESARTIADAHAEADRIRTAAEQAAAEQAAAERAAAEQAAAEQAAAEQAAAELAAAERAAVEAAVIAEAEAAAFDDVEPAWAPIDDEQPVEESVVEAPVVEAAVVEETVVEETVEVLQPTEVISTPITLSADTATDSPFARQTLPPPPPQQINVSIDAEAFAKVFATVFASIVEQRMQYAPPAPAYVPYAIAPPAPAAPVKQGFWHHARHPDVLLLGLATAIVLVVLAAWLA